MFRSPLESLYLFNVEIDFTAGFESLELGGTRLICMILLSLPSKRPSRILILTEMSLTALVAPWLGKLFLLSGGYKAWNDEFAYKVELSCELSVHTNGSRFCA